jgi:pyrroloquinoline quinone biosynthesis protein B
MDVLDDVTVDIIASVDIAIIDGTFYSTDEVPGAMAAVPHPPVKRSMEMLQGAVRRGTRVVFTHLNHTNPLCDPSSPAMEEVLLRGFEVAADGMTLEI